MALQVAMKIRGIDCPEAYVRVVNTQPRRIPNDTLIEVLVYPSAAAIGVAVPEQRPFLFAYDAECNVPNAYLKLKTLSEFAGAADA